jgi:outer membrane protein
LEQIQESEKVGSLALADVYRQQTTVEQNNYAVITANSNYEKAKLDVLNFLGVDPAKVFTFDFSGVPTDVDTMDFVSLNAMYKDSLALINGAIQQRPDYLSNVAAYNSADVGVSAADGGYLPSLTASATYGGQNAVLGDITQDRELAASLNLSIPIFNGFQTQTNIQQAEIARDNANQTLLSTKRQVVVDVRKALLDLQASEQEIISGQKGVVSSSLDAQTAHEKYNLGSNTLLDVLTAEANYTSALSNKVNGVNDFLLAKKELEYALGTIKN